MDYTEIFEKVAYAVAGLLGFGYGLKKFWKSKTKTDNFIAIHTEIHELLTEIRVNSKAMRVSVLQFHNGEYFMDGISMRKFSITHESSHRGYISQSLKFKNVLCSLFIPLLNKVLEDKPTIHHVEAMSNSYAKHFFEDENISHYSCLPLKNKNVNIGFILLQWHFDFPPEMENQEAITNYLSTIRDSVQIQLSYQKN
jgi:hypothetical protein